MLVTKLTVVVASGLTAYLHVLARTSKALACTRLSGATALAAVMLGVLLAGWPPLHPKAESSDLAP